MREPANETSDWFGCWSNRDCLAPTRLIGRSHAALVQQRALLGLIALAIDTRGKALDGSLVSTVCVSGCQACRMRLLHSHSHSRKFASPELLARLAATVEPVELLRELEAANKAAELECFESSSRRLLISSLV